jgi:hypothetical protein
MVLGQSGYILRQAKGDIEHDERAYMIPGEYRSASPDNKIDSRP